MPAGKAVSATPAYGYGTGEYSPPCRQHSFARQLGLEGSFQLCEVLRRDGLERGPQRCHDAADRLFSLLLSGLHGLLDFLLVAAAGDRPERLPEELCRILQRAGALAQDLPEGGADGADIGLIAHTLDGIAHLGGAPRPRRRDPAGPQRVVGQAERVVVPPCHLHEPPEPQDEHQLPEHGLLLLSSSERYPFEGLGLPFNFSFQTPIRASGFIDRSDNLTYSSA